MELHSTISSFLSFSHPLDKYNFSCWSLEFLLPSSSSSSTIKSHPLNERFRLFVKIDLSIKRVFIEQFMALCMCVCVCVLNDGNELLENKKFVWNEKEISE